MSLRPSAIDVPATPTDAGNGTEPRQSNDPPRGPSRKAARIAAAAAAVALALFVVGFLPRQRRAAEARAASVARAHERVRVEVVHPKSSGAGATTMLQGSIEPLRETAVYARANGYVGQWKVDIGDRVTAGQVLAVLETPELDQEYAQARAGLLTRRAGIAQARALVAFSRAKVKRFEPLTQKGVTSQQDFDDKSTKAALDEATLTASEAALQGDIANLRRLEELRAFNRIRAPFDGLITARYVEVGTLVTAGTGGAQGLFRIAATDPVRVFALIPQEWALSVHPGMTAEVRVPELPNRSFAGKVTRTAGALDPTTRMMRTEIQVPNHDGGLLTGMYAEVTMALAYSHPSLVVPSTALLLDSGGMHVAVVGEGDKVAMRRVALERDTGPEAILTSGITPEDRVIVNPGEMTREGMVVQAVER
jgi:membrane fusion protein, multidrug efflux system